jgi:hypothetical protein
MSNTELCLRMTTGVRTGYEIGTGYDATLHAFRMVKMPAENDHHKITSEIAIIKAEENGVTICAVTSENIEPDPPVRLDNGEVYLMLISRSVRGYKIRGRVLVLTSLGEIHGSSSLIIGSGLDLDNV